MRTFKYIHIDYDKKEKPLRAFTRTITDREILSENWINWKDKMESRDGKSVKINKENCVNYFVTKLRAWEHPYGEGTSNGK